MKKIKDLESIKNGKYKSYSGSDKLHNWQIIILDYNYGDPQLIIKNDLSNWIELPNGLSGSFTSRGGNPYNNMTFTLDKLYSEKLSGRSVEDECNLYQDGDNLLLIINGNFSFMRPINIDLNLEYEECPSIREVESTYVVGNNTIVIDNLKYKSSYKTYRFFFNDEEWLIKKFNRYRDGGTTEIEVQDLNGNLHEFYTPSPFNKDKVPYIVLNGFKLVLTKVKD